MRRPQPIARVLSIFAIFSLALAGVACASGGGGEGGSQPATDAAAAEPAPVKGAAPPADHRMAALKTGMSNVQVQEIMGAPTNEKSYITGKAFNPFTQYGNDSGRRVEYAYAGEGRVVFAVPRWGGSLKVVRIDYDPNEDGN